MFSGASFNFESLKLEIKVEQYRGSRQQGLNPGVLLTVMPANTTIVIGCNDFIRNIQTNPSYYKNLCESQASEINKLIELIETIQNQANPDEINKLDRMKTCISQACANAVQWLFNEELQNRFNAYQYVIPGKRVDAATFKLVEVSPKNTLTK